MNRRFGVLFSLALLSPLAAGCGDPDVADELFTSSAESLTQVSGSLSLTSEWGSGYCAEVSILNGNTVPTTSWTVVVDLRQSVLSGGVWNASASTAGTKLTASSLSWNAAVAPKGRASFGFCATKTGANYLPVVVSVVSTPTGTSTGTTTSSTSTTTSNTSTSTSSTSTSTSSTSTSTSSTSTSTSSTSTSTSSTSTSTSSTSTTTSSPFLQLAKCPRTPRNPDVAAVAGNLNSQPEVFYKSEVAFDLAENLFYYQGPYAGTTTGKGGWPKGHDWYHRAASPDTRMMLDNGSTIPQIRFLSRIVANTGCSTYATHVYDGLRWLFDAQYDGANNGGWPMQYPLSGTYRDLITYNDGSVIMVMQELRAMRDKQAPYGWLPEAQRLAASAAFDRGLRAILATQVKTKAGVRQAWGAQHNPATLLPARGRCYEYPSNSGAEGAGVLAFLLTVPATPEVIAAVEGAVRWFDKTPMKDGRWSRFYALEGDANGLATNTPFWVDRTAVVPDRCTFPKMTDFTTTVAGYAWVGTWPRAVLAKYRAWADTNRRAYVIDVSKY